MDELRDAARALDRVFMHEHYVVPDLYAGTNRVSRWDKFGIPKIVPKYYTIATPERLAAVGGDRVVGQVTPTGSKPPASDGNEHPCSPTSASACC